VFLGFLNSLEDTNTLGRDISATVDPIVIQSAPIVNCIFMSNKLLGSLVFSLILLFVFARVAIDQQVPII